MGDKKIEVGVDLTIPSETIKQGWSNPDLKDGLWSIFDVVTSIK